MTVRKLVPVAALVALGLGLAFPGCNQVILTAPPGSSLTCFANPTFISSNGGVSVISCIAIEPIGTPVADGTVVQFFTNLGQIPEQGKTNDGVVRVNLIADSRSGTATVTAISGGPAVSSSGGTSGSGSGSGTLDVTIGNVNATVAFVTANPSRITDSRSTHVTATVFDERGNPASSVPVYFKVTTDPATEYMDSQGAPIFTDNNGRAEDVMRTRRAVGSTVGPAKVTVTVPTAAGLITAEVEIPIALQ
jgi:hypothetical protein